MSDAFQTTEGTETVTEVKFEDLVGEGKKYRDQDAAARAIAEKDRFIEQLKREAAEMRASIQKRENEREFLDRLEQIAKAKSPEAGDPPPKDGTEATAITPETVEQIIERREAQKRADDNLKTVVNKLTELYGDDYKRHVSKTAQQIGMTTADLTQLASQNPQAFFRIVGVEGQAKERDAFQAPPRSSMSTPMTSNSNVKNYAYFQKIRAEKGEAAYFQPSVQMEMWNSLKTMGEDEFYKK